MSKIQFITGGVASGKTRWAITYYEACDNVLYLCVSDELDKEIEDRINFNSNKHGVEWDIIKGIKKPASYIDKHKFIIFDGLGAYVSRAISEKCPDVKNMTRELQKDIQKEVITDISELIDTVKDINGELLIISVEAGFSVIPEDDGKTCFREILGGVNQRIANLSTDVFLSASGIQFKIK